MFEPLPLSKVEEVLSRTWAVEALATSVLRKDKVLQNHLLFWTMSHNLPVGEFEQKRDVVEKLLGRPPEKVLTNEFKSYIWGLSYKENPVLLLVSDRGTSIEILPEFPKDLIGDMLRAIRKVLVNPEYRDNLFFKNKHMKTI